MSAKVLFLLKDSPPGMERCGNDPATLFPLAATLAADRVLVA